MLSKSVKSGNRDALKLNAVSSLKMSTGFVMLVLIADGVLANQPQSALSTVLHWLAWPGFIVLTPVLKWIPPPIIGGFALAAGFTLDVALYAGLILLAKEAVSDRSRSGSPRLVTLKRKPGVSRALRAFKIGFGIAGLLILLSLVTPWHGFEFLVFAGSHAYSSLFGFPSHGALGPFVLFGMFVNALIYSGCVFLVLLLLDHFRSKSGTT